MNKSTLCKRLILSAFFVAATSWIHALAAPDQPRIIEVIGDKDNMFKVPGKSKPVITLHPAEVVTLRITAHFGGERSRDNYVHSFVIKKLRDQGWDLRLKEGTEDFTVTAPQATGEYLAECTVKCGRGHDDMNMKVIVNK
jgi:heme/copper-type cytochrome/quinol oxidase subunit 2